MRLVKLYHATYCANLEGIMEQGLVPGKRKNWRDCEDGFVYLATDPEVAVDFCEAAEDVPDEVYESGICCFEVDSGVLDGKRLVADPNMLEDDEIESGCFAYVGKIPFNDLVLVYREGALAGPEVGLDEKIQMAREEHGGLEPGGFLRVVGIDR